MKRLIIAAAALAAACSPPASTTTATATGPMSLMQQAQAKSPEEMPVYGWQLLTQYQTAHPDSTPVCHSVRETTSRGVIPADVASDSIYAPYVGSLVIAVQCGPQLTGVPLDPHEHWLVVLAPGAADPQIVNCADAHGHDACPREVPHAAAATAPPAGATKTN